MNLSILGYGIGIYLLMTLLHGGFASYVMTPFELPFNSPEPNHGIEPGTVRPNPGLTAVVNALDLTLQILTWLVPGYAAGRWARDLGMRHGFVIGGVGFICSTVVWRAVFSEDVSEIFMHSNLYFFFLAALLTGMAAAVGELHSIKGVRF